MKEFLTVKQTAELLRYHPNAIYKAIANGELPALRLGGRYRVDMRVIEEMFKEMRGGGNVEQGRTEQKKAA